MEDKEIVQLYWDRNERAVSETSEKYGKYCTHIAMNILHSREDAEECVNDAYLKTWNAIPPNRPALLSTFLGKIVRNLSFNKYKSMHTMKRGGTETAIILDELCDIVSDRESVEDDIIRNDLVSVINEFVNSLTEVKRYIFIRRYWYADSVSEIASKSRRSEGSTSVELSRIRKKLCDFIIEKGYDI